LLGFTIAGVLNETVDAATELLPGLTYCGHKERLAGKLVFLFGDNAFRLGTNEMSANIYEFNLQGNDLRKITVAPGGLFIASNDGKVFCVLYGVDPVSHDFGTNAFVYADDIKQSRIVSIGRPPLDTVVVDHHVFFQIKTNYNERILELDLETGVQRLVEMPGASKWEHTLFKNLHPAPEKPNLLHFDYSAFGMRSAQGRDYPAGCYSLDVNTGAVAWFTNVDEEWFSYKAADGNYVWFEGADAPIHGHRLVSSPLNDSWAKIEDPKGRHVKLLKVFSRLKTLTGSTYNLEQMSPCRRYALIRFAVPIMETKSGSPGWANTYYSVDATSGEATVLLKEEVRRKTVGFISHVRWVGEASGR